MITVGIDVGALTTKAVMMKDGKVLAYQLVFTSDSGYEAATRAVEELTSLTRVSRQDIAKFVATGAGKSETPYEAEQATEVLCDARGTLFHYPSARMVIDMGAESSRIIKCSPNGRVLDFSLNDKCAAGTGIFLDSVAKALEVRLEDIGPLSLQASEDITITATCSVFAESEVVGLIARGFPKASILSGVHKSVANRIYGLANRLGIIKDIVFIGGGAKNVGIIKSLEALLKQTLLIPQDPQIVGAIGAALIAQERIR